MGSGISKDSISISIKETKRGGKRIASLNSNKYRTPASIAKAATTYAALLELGDSYRWPTKVYTSGTISSGTLDGDIAIKGFGDPSLNSKSIDKIVSYIQAKGIERIDGNIILDKSYFETSNACSAKFDENPSSDYNSLPSAIMFNDNLTTIKIINGNEVVQNINDDSYDISNEIVPTDAECRRANSWPSVRVEYGDRAKLKLGGTVSKNCPTIVTRCIITQPYNSFYGSLSDKLKSNGIKYNGTLKLKKVPSSAKEIATIYSEPIFSIIGHTNKKSDNMYARQIFLTLGAKEYGAPGTLEKSRKALISIFDKNDINHASAFKLDNGSGLSRTAKVTTQSFEGMLDQAYASHGQRWLNALSIAGVDGTIKSRFPSSLTRRVWMKTGTVNKVKNIVGYVRATDGTMYTVAIIINDRLAASRGAALENTIISWLANSNVSQYGVENQDYKERETPKDKPKEIKIFENMEPATQEIEPNMYQPAQNTSTQQFYIQVGIYAGEIDSVMTSKLKAHNFSYKAVKLPLAQRLVAGPFGSKQDTQNALNIIRQSIASDAFVVQ